VFRIDEMIAYTRPHHGGAEIIIDIRDPQTLDRKDATALLYEQAEALADSIAGELRLDSAGPFDIDPLEGWHFDPYLFRAGHWVLALADVQQDPSSRPHFAWGADLQGRFTTLVPPPGRPPAVDWNAVDRLLPADYRWLIDTYGPGPIGGSLDLIAPGRLSDPLLTAGPLPGALSASRSAPGPLPGSSSLRTGWPWPPPSTAPRSRGSCGRRDHGRTIRRRR
jgi:hypothetical protein